MPASAWEGDSESPIPPGEQEGSSGPQGSAEIGRSSLVYLQKLIERRSLDTVIVAGVDFQGRLFGKHLEARHFLGVPGTYASVAALANDIRLELVDGLSFGGWDSGFPDVLLRPIYSTARLISWRPGSAIVLADIVAADGKEVESSPRAVLRRQVERAAALGLSVYSGSELEFYVFRESAETARAKGYNGLNLLSNFPADYNLLRSSRDEWFFQSLRNALMAADIPVESSKPEWGHSQGEVNLAFTEVMEMADRHVVFKQAVKEIAETNDLLVTFMAKPFTEQPGSGCHIHMSLRRSETGEVVFHDPSAPLEMSETMGISWAACRGWRATCFSSTPLTSTHTSASSPATSHPAATSGEWITAPRRFVSPATAPACASRTASRGPT
jgi:glutamine synthetase